jgi:hypothetical protein
MEDMLAMVGLGESAGVGQDAEPPHPRASNSRTPLRLTCTRAYASVIGRSHRASISWPG